MATNTEEKSFEKQVTRYIRNLEYRALEADITDMDENAETAHIDVFRGGRVVSELKLVPRWSSKGAIQGVEATCVRCHSITTCPFYGSRTCPKFTIH